MPLCDPKKPLPAFLRRGKYPDTIEFDLPDGTTGWATFESKPVGMGATIVTAIIERYNSHKEQAQ
jgi:hypothetical protein